MKRKAFIMILLNVILISMLAVRPVLAEVITSKPTHVDGVGRPATKIEPIEPLKPLETKPVEPIAVETPQTSTPTPNTAPVGGNCAEWIAQAGITDVANANELIRRESGCNPNARNSSSGACGIAQELPCGKSGCSLGDGACQVKWMHSYVIGRYGSWASAVAFHDRNNWY